MKSLIIKRIMFFALLVYLAMPSLAYALPFDISEIKKMTADTLKNVPPETLREMIKMVPPDIIERFKKQIAEDVKKDLLRELAAKQNSEVQSSQKSETKTDEMVKLTSYQGSEPPKIDSLLSRKDQVFVEKVVILVHPSNPVEFLTPDEVLKMWTGQQTTWKKCGWNDTEVHLMVSSTSTRGIVNATRSGKSTTCMYNSIILPLVANNPGAIGFVPISSREQTDTIQKVSHVKTVPIREVERTMKRDL